MIEKKYGKNPICFGKISILFFSIIYTASCLFLIYIDTTILPVYVVCLSIISNLSLSAGIRMEACNRKRYVDNKLEIIDKQTTYTGRIPYVSEKSQSSSSLSFIPLPVIFPKHMGFFPYMWFVYLLFPIYHLAQASGWKLVYTPKKQTSSEQNKADGM
jgi:hypothetical protein